MSKPTYSSYLSDDQSAYIVENDDQQEVCRVEIDEAPSNPDGWPSRNAYQNELVRRARETATLIAHMLTMSGVRVETQ